jgi:hypothetical protein
LTWSLAILDDGVTNATQARAHKHTASEFDYYRNRADTDEGFADTHANRVFLSALSVSRSFEVVDLKVGAPADRSFSYGFIEIGLAGLLASPDGPVGAVNMSFGGPSYPVAFADEIGRLGERGIIAVAASGNGGSRDTLESPSFPAALPNVIAVGSHDGDGNPSSFSRNGPGVAILADGEDMPEAGSRGTSFAAPRVAATVTHVQAIVQGLTGSTLDTAGMMDALRQGGAGPRSRPDPADGETRYFLHDHAGSLDYAWSRYGGSPARALEYVASYLDLIAALHADLGAGRLHFERHGSVEERAITFDGLDYIATYGDLIRAFGADGRAGSIHFIATGSREGRSTSFDGLDYIASYPDLILAFGAEHDVGSAHFVRSGWTEGRAPDLFDSAQYLANYADLQAAFGSDEEAATRHFITNGFAEGRTDDPLPAATDFLV